MVSQLILHVREQRPSIGTLNYGSGMNLAALPRLQDVASSRHIAHVQGAESTPGNSAQMLHGTAGQAGQQHVYLPRPVWKLYGKPVIAWIGGDGQTFFRHPGHVRIAPFQCLHLHLGPHVQADVLRHGSSSPT